MARKEWVGDHVNSVAPIRCCQLCRCPCAIAAAAHKQQYQEYKKYCTNNRSCHNPTNIRRSAAVGIGKRCCCPGSSRNSSGRVDNVSRRPCRGKTRHAAGHTVNIGDAVNAIGHADKPCISAAPGSRRISNALEGGARKAQRNGCQCADVGTITILLQIPSTAYRFVAISTVGCCRHATFVESRVIHGRNPRIVFDYLTIASPITRNWETWTLPTGGIASAAVIVAHE